MVKTALVNQQMGECINARVDGSFEKLKFSSEQDKNAKRAVYQTKNLVSLSFLKENIFYWSPN